MVRPDAANDAKSPPGCSDFDLEQRNSTLGRQHGLNRLHNCRRLRNGWADDFHGGPPRWRRVAEPAAPAPLPGNLSNFLLEPNIGNFLWEYCRREILPAGLRVLPRGNTRGSASGRDSMASRWAIWSIVAEATIIRRCVSAVACVQPRGPQDRCQSFPRFPMFFMRTCRINSSVSVLNSAAPGR